MVLFRFYLAGVLTIPIVVLVSLLLEWWENRDESYLKYLKSVNWGRLILFSLTSWFGYAFMFGYMWATKEIMEEE